MLERRARSKTASVRDVTRARVILLAADGEPNTAIADVVGIHYNNVAVWRPYDFDRIHGAWFGRVVAADAKGIVERSAERYINAIEGA